MIGNDIVDLALAQKQSNWKRKGFLAKIFTQYEQSLIVNSQNQDCMVWNLWSRKEAAYKIYNRQTGIRGFFPLQFACDYQNIEKGTVSIKENIYHTFTEITKEFIHTIAVSKTSDLNNIKLLDSKIKIEKVNGIPFIKDVVNQINKPVSISHHGRFQINITIL